MVVDACLLTFNNYCSITSSAAQCGGGSFTKGNLQERLFDVNHGWQSEPKDGSKGQDHGAIFLSIYLAVYLCIYLSVYLLICVSICLCIYLVYLSICSI